MNDLEELAALNRQIAELRSVLSAVLPHVMWFHVSNARECIYCHCEIVYEVDHLSCHHTPDCPYRRAKELAADADSPPSGSR